MALRSQPHSSTKMRRLLSRMTRPSLLFDFTDIHDILQGQTPQETTPSWQEGCFTIGQN